MKPYPFASLNHFTVPLAIETPPLLLVNWWGRRFAQTGPVLRCLHDSRQGRIRRIRAVLGRWICACPRGLRRACVRLPLELFLAALAHGLLPAQLLHRL